NSRIWNNLGEFRTLSDNEVPENYIKGAWQTPASIYQETWGYRKWQVRDNINQKVASLIRGLLGGGNYLLNIGPTGEGAVVPFEAKVLRAIGEWINRHPQVLEAQKNDILDVYDWGSIK